MTTQNNQIKKPFTLRIIFILNALMMILPFAFYFVITSKNIEIGGLNPQFMIYTGIAYILTFTAMVYCILNKKMTAFRIIFIINILIAIPASAYIGILVAIISLLLSNEKRVKAFFNN